MDQNLINKIARLVTDEPDILNEADFERRSLERRSDSPESRKKLRRTRERYVEHGPVTVDGLLNSWIELAGKPEELARSIDLYNRYLSNRDRIKRTIADQLNEYAPNFSRAQIYRIIKILEVLWETEERLVIIDDRVRAAEAGNPNPGDALISHDLDGIVSYLKTYYNTYLETLFSMRERLAKILGQELVVSRAPRPKTDSEVNSIQRSFLRRVPGDPYVYPEDEVLENEDHYNFEIGRWARFIPEARRDEFLEYADAWWVNTPPNEKTRGALLEYLRAFEAYE